MMKYTDEQLAYIKHNVKEDTKLLACAGSGKTRCIIARISHLISKKIYKPSSILMLTFSRFTRDDFLQKVRKINKNSVISESSIKTIDAFAKLVIDSNNTVDVSLLSYRLMKFLEENSASKLKKIKQLSMVKTIFVDEAQDLNYIQKKIFMLMREKLGIIINMVGDPNQNIYQFRKSSDKYLTDFDGHVFTLTHNFRSHSGIVEFSKPIRPIADNDVICTKGDNECKPTMLFYENEKILENYIVEILNEAIKQGFDLSNFAILAPTRGRMRGGGKSHGLCFVSNILYKAKIKFKQFYEETTDDIASEGIRYEPEKGHVNILTFMGSKGLEWEYVILIDADVCLINKRYFDKTKHDNDRYLLYVACSRAIDNMYIFSRCNTKSFKPTFSTNPWFEKVPCDLYKMDERYEKCFAWPEIKYVDISEKDTSLFKVIDKIDCYELEEIAKIINHRDVKPKCNKIFNKTYVDMDRSNNKSNIFLSKYVTNLFRSLSGMISAQSNTDNLVRYSDVEMIIDTDVIVTEANDEIAKWYYSHRKFMTWDKFDRIDKIDWSIKNFINQNFDRTKSFDKHAIITNGYYEHYIIEHSKWIKNIYSKYLRCKNVKQMNELVFYLTVISHAINTQHYFHIKSRGDMFKSILSDYSELFDEIYQYVLQKASGFSKANINVNRWDLTGTVDYIDESDGLWMLKCTSDISLKHLIYAITCDYE